MPGGLILENGGNIYLIRQKDDDRFLKNRE